MIVTATPASNHFLRKPAFRKGEKLDQKWARNPGPFLEPSSIGTIAEGSENGPILGPHFGAGKPLLSSFLELQNLDTDREIPSNATSSSLDAAG